jgi:hypothetical protein
VAHSCHQSYRESQNITEIKETESKIHTQILIRIGNKSIDGSAIPVKPDTDNIHPERGEIVDSMFTECSLNVHLMLTEYSLNVH